LTPAATKEPLFSAQRLNNDKGLPPMPRLEDVFKQQGVPTHTFVEPQEFERLLVALRTPGRNVIIEGPSGIGKTTAVEYALRHLNISTDITRLSPRKRADIEYIENLHTIDNAGIVLIDDFHKIAYETKLLIADYIKILADEEIRETKLILVGINDAGRSLIALAQDITTRIERIRFESNPDYKIEELVTKGEAALNVTIPFKSDIVATAKGGFYVAQMLSYESCLKGGALESGQAVQILNVSFESIKAQVQRRLSDRFRHRTVNFCRGNKFNREGRAPYLHILYWLAKQDDWSISLDEAIRVQRTHRGSVGQVVEKGFLKDLVEQNDDIQEVLHYDEHTHRLSVEDPQYIFYLRNIPWRSFAGDIGFVNVTFESRYDFALSFAGKDRNIAEHINDELRRLDFEVFYDMNEQFRMLAQDLEEYLEPIYQSEARFVICIMSSEYPSRIWTRFESEAFGGRFSRGEVIPVLVDDFEPSNFDILQKIGYWRLRNGQSLDCEIRRLVDDLRRKIVDGDEAGQRALFE
jgi:hypothetical protein